MNEFSQFSSHGDEDNIEERNPFASRDVSAVFTSQLLDGHVLVSSRNDSPVEQVQSPAGRRDRHNRIPSLHHGEGGNFVQEEGFVSSRLQAVTAVAEQESDAFGYPILDQGIAYAYGPECDRQKHTQVMKPSELEKCSFRGSDELVLTSSYVPEFDHQYWKLRDNLVNLEVKSISKDIF